jgi:hypothetical protein
MPMRRMAQSVLLGGALVTLLPPWTAARVEAKRQAAFLESLLAVRAMIP